ncbi:MAG: YggN family protein [Colwelliaceae bacterium]|jgi:hypothetical protein|nr:YggN family protein [Colwelliaceae bacterium]
MKTLLATAILLSTTSAFAHDTSFSSESCDVELNAGLRINKNLIEFTKNDKSLYQIIDNETLIVNGEKISLDSSQQSLVSEYSTSIRSVIPEVKEIAVDAIEIAVEGVNLAFNELLGEGNELGEELTTQLHLIRDEVDQRFDSEKEFYIDENGNLDDDFFGEEFEQRIETVVEETIQNSLGSLLIAVGQEMLFSGGDMDAFETRMENFGEQIEHDIETRAEKLEERGNELCHSVYNIDRLETQLSQQINELSDFDVISADVDKRNKA